MTSATTTPSRSRGLMMGVARWIASVGIVAITVYLVDLEAVWARFRGIDAAWLVVALGLSVPLYAIMATRWWFTASRVGAPLSYWEAGTEYYASTFVNSVMPVSIAGDALRVVRHKKRLAAHGMQRSFGRALAAAVIDRLSGHLSLVLLGCATAIAWISRGRADLIPLAGAAALVLLAAAAGAALLARARLGDALHKFRGDAYQALVARGALGIQLGLSTAQIALMVAMFYASGRAVGNTLDFITTLQVVPLVLASSLLPLSFNGWGVREATAAAVFGMVGLAPEDGVAASVSFGLVSLMAAMPGAIVLACAPIAYGRRR